MLKLVGMKSKRNEQCPVGIVSVDSRWSRCDSRMSYPSRGAALAAASRGCTLSRTADLKPYKCPYCHRWHLISCERPSSLRA